MGCCFSKTSLNILARYLCSASPPYFIYSPAILPFPHARASLLPELLGSSAVFVAFIAFQNLCDALNSFYPQVTHSFLYLVANVSFSCLVWSFGCAVRASFVHASFLRFVDPLRICRRRGVGMAVEF